MAISTSLINLQTSSPRNQPPSSSSPNNHRLVSVLPLPALPQRSQHTLSYRQRCSLSAAIPHQSYLREDDLKKELISAIGEELVSVQKGGTVECLHEALTLVDLIQRLGIHRWDASPVENLPLHKAIFESMYHTINEIGIAASKAQGRDLLPYIRELWQDLVDGYYEEAQWQFSCHSPSLEEYLPVATRTAFSFAVISSHIFILGEAVTDEAQQFFGKDSHLLYLVGVVTRLANDFGTADRELENERSPCNAIACYMKDHAGCTKEEAVLALKEMREASFREMEYEIFRSRGIVPDICIQAAMHFVQATGITYRMADGHKTTMDIEYEELVKDYMGY